MVSPSLCSSTSSSTRHRRSNTFITIFQMLTKFLNQKKYAAKPVLTIYVIK
uniref:Candidate secreted effector n=1 Tax=Meloidogyne incognita TaxID=6306 RepID=A0A914M374_MELIC